MNIVSAGPQLGHPDPANPPPPAKVSLETQPRGSLEVLSQREIARLRDASQGGLYDLLRRCSLAVLNSGAQSDDAVAMLERYSDFEVEVVQTVRGIRLDLRNAPASAFVDGKLIEGIREHLFAVLRDLVRTDDPRRHGATDSARLTDQVFDILRNAHVWDRETRPNLVVCWGGHSITRNEYEYTKEVGYRLGLRGLDICTGCGPGAMKGPMKGAAVAHAKQRIRDGSYVGLTEPGIIAAESPNPIVNKLVILPDIEKRLEAFVRTGHAIIVFPGGVGTAEEVLFVLGILLHPDNAEQSYPLILTGPRSAEAYLRGLDRFITAVLGEQARSMYRIVLDDPDEVARRAVAGVKGVHRQRRRSGDAFYFNWLLEIGLDFQLPFEVTHESVAGIELSGDLPVHERAVNLRRLFSAIVTGNVKESGVRAIERHGPFEITGDRTLVEPLDELLRGFVADGRMKIEAGYEPCYRLVS